MSSYKELKGEFESLKRMQASTHAAYVETASRLAVVDQENGRMRAQVDSIRHEHRQAGDDASALRSQLRAKAKEVDALIRERDELRDRLGAATAGHRDLVGREVAASVEAMRRQFSVELARLREEKEAAVAEYQLVMSERDSVHRELDHLQELLAAADVRCQRLERQNAPSGENGALRRSQPQLTATTSSSSGVLSEAVQRDARDGSADGSVSKKQGLHNFGDNLMSAEMV